MHNFILRYPTSFSLLKQETSLKQFPDFRNEQYPIWTGHLPSTQVTSGTVLYHLLPDRWKLESLC